MKKFMVVLCMATALFSGCLTGDDTDGYKIVTDYNSMTERAVVPGDTLEIIQGGAIPGASSVSILNDVGDEIYYQRLYINARNVWDVDEYVIDNAATMKVAVARVGKVTVTASGNGRTVTVMAGRLSAGFYKYKFDKAMLEGEVPPEW